MSFILLIPEWFVHNWIGFDYTAKPIHSSEVSNKTGPKLADSSGRGNTILVFGGIA